MKAGVETPTQIHPGHQRLHSGITRQKALCFLWSQNRFPNNPLGSHIFWISSPGACLSDQISTSATSRHTADFSPLFSPTKSQTKPQQDPPCLQAPTCHGPSWTQQTPSQICSRTWQPPTLSLRNASGLRRCWVFSPDAPHGKTNKHTHLLTAP